MAKRNDNEQFAEMTVDEKLSVIHDDNTKILSVLNVLLQSRPKTKIEEPLKPGEKRVSALVAHVQAARAANKKG